MTIKYILCLSMLTAFGARAADGNVTAQKYVLIRVIHNQQDQPEARRWSKYDTIERVKMPLDEGLKVADVLANFQAKYPVFYVNIFHRDVNCAGFGMFRDKMQDKVIDYPQQKRQNGEEIETFTVSVHWPVEAKETYPHANS